jgi:PPOX class probable F420-dependent enzyme
MKVTLQTVEAFVKRDHGLAVVSVVRPDGTPVGSLVNAGVLDHPTTGERCVGFVVRGDAKKAHHLRYSPHAPFASLVWRDGWQWVGISGAVELIGPDDAAAGIDAAGVRTLLRTVFQSAGGTHDDWDTYDRVMADERRLAVLVRPTRLTGNPSV